ncbi:AraC-like DNA-binding protein [Ancylomarina subtilis]|uniref:AraC-like DNA-binding protein n=2 Tax=Ancylomarina subtilis TaxID=1639035 RepID=A0A4Q7VHE3_9BACT|nr:AraC-like DNA-binding protein [Ancylomarina subtilis]
MMFFQFGRLGTSLIFLSLSFNANNTMIKAFLTSIFLLLLICSSKLQADQHFQNFHKYTTEHGIANNTILSIFQDSVGRIWIGCLEGLSLYDGSKFISFKNSDSLASNTIVFIDQINTNQLLLGTNKGNYIFSITEKTFTKILLPENENSPATALFRIKKKTFICSLKGIYEYNTQTHSGQKVHERPISCKQLSPDNKILLGTNNNGIWEANLKVDKLELSQFFATLTNESIKAIRFQRDGTPVILSEKGLWLGSKDRAKHVISGTFSSLDISPQDELLLGTHGQFIQQVYHKNEKFALKDYIGQDNKIFNDYFDAHINVLFKDHSGVIWIGTTRAGLDRIDRKKITYNKYKNKSQPHNPEAGYINALTQSEDGKIWVGTSGKGLYLLNKEKKELVPVKILNQNMDTLYIEALLQNKNNLYIGTRYHGIIVAKYPPRNFNQIRLSGQIYSSKAGLEKMDYIYSLKHFNNQLYISSAKGTFKYDFKTKHTEIIDSRPSINIKMDSLNNKWIVSDDMSLFFNQTQIKLETEVSDILLSKNQGIWVPTSKGLAFIENENKTPVFYNPPQKVIEFTSIKEDQQGNLWLGSRMGIYQFKPESKIFSTYQITGGAKANSFNHGKILQTSQDEFYWGSNDGLVSIRPFPGEYLPPAAFEVERDSLKNPAVFQVNNYSFNHQDDNSIAYRFSHPDSVWHLIAQNNAILDFSDLKKGSYTINISAVNADGLFNKSYQTINFDIENSNKSGLNWWLLLIVSLTGTIIIFFKRKQTPNPIEESESCSLIETPEDKIYNEWMCDDFMQKAIKIIEENLSNTSFGVSELYLSMQMSKSNFYRKLKTITDLSPNELIRFIRLQKSTQMLITPNLSVNEIAYEVGFNTPSYFTRCFKQQYGIAPSEYKEHYDSIYAIAE